MLKVLLFGATGAIGKDLPELLIRNPEVEVFATSRRKRKSRWPSQHWIMGNAHDEAFVFKCLDSIHPDVVVDFMHYPTCSFRSRYRRVLSKTGQYVFLSSCRVFADCGCTAIREDSPLLVDTVADRAFLSTDEYALAKARQERLLRDSGCSNWTIVRPYITYGEGRFQFQCLEASTLGLRSLQGLSVPYCQDIADCLTTMTDGRDVAKMIAGLVLKPRALGESFNLTSSQHTRWSAIAEIYKRLLGLRFVKVSQGEYEAITRTPYQIKYDRSLNRIFDNSKILAFCNLSQRDLIPLEVGLSERLRSFADNPVFYRSDILGNARMDSFFGERIDLSKLTPPNRFLYFSEKHWITRIQFVRKIGLSIVWHFGVK